MAEGQRPEERGEAEGDPGHAPPGLEIEQDLEFQRRDWRLERWGWGVMLGLVAAALLGLCGTGPLSDQIAGEKGGPLWVEYQLFGRWKAPEELIVHVGPGQTRDGHAQVWLSRQLVERHEIEHVTPPPERVEMLGDRYVYVLCAPVPSADLAITFTLKPERWGVKKGTIGIEGGPQVRVHELVYP